MVVALISVCLIGREASGLAVQERPSARALVDEFRASASFWRQLDVAKKLVALRSTEALDWLEPWLMHHDRHIRGNVAFVFAALRDPRGLETLAGILNDRSERQEGQGIPGGRWTLERQIGADRYYAVHLLGELKDAQTVELLLPLLNDEQVNYKVAWALGEIGDRRAVRPLIDALGHSKALVRISAIQALEKLGAREALPYLRTLLNDHELPSAGDQVSVAATARAAIAKLSKEP
jgi:HEAT repeat protein